MENCQITVTNECSRLASIRGRENRMLVWPLTIAGTDCLDRIGLRIGSDRTGNSPSIQSYTKSNCLLVVVRLRGTRPRLLVNENNVSDTWRGHSLYIDNMSSVAIVPCSFPRFFKRLLWKEAFYLGSVKNKTNSEESMSRNLARQISRDLLSDCFAMVSAAGFYCDSRAHNVWKVRVVKYIVVYRQIKAADKKYCHNQRWRRQLEETSFRTRGFGDNLDEVWPRYCRAKVVDLSRVVEAYL